MQVFNFFYYSQDKEIKADDTKTLDSAEADEKPVENDKSNDEGGGDKSATETADEVAEAKESEAKNAKISDEKDEKKPKDEGNFKVNFRNLFVFYYNKHFLI